MRFSGVYDKALTDENGDTVLSFTVRGREGYEARQKLKELTARLKGGKERLTVEVDAEKRRRSMTANAYFWVLCDKIAEKTGSSKTEVYRHYVHESGVFKEIVVNEQAADTFVSVWGRNGEGWLVDRIDVSPVPHFVVLHAYYGSSTYNVRQMSRLVDSAVEDCVELEIETLPTAEIVAMKARWGQ